MPNASSAGAETPWLLTQDGYGHPTCADSGKCADRWQARYLVDLVTTLRAQSADPARPRSTRPRDPNYDYIANEDQNMGLSTFRERSTRRIALALAAAATALFAWLSQSNAEVITYRIGDDPVGAGAFFGMIPSPPPTTAAVRIVGSFDYDAETHMQTNVRLRVTGGLGAVDYVAVFPRTPSLPSACKDCVIFAGRPGETAGVVQKFTEVIYIRFEFPLDGKVSTNPITKVFIDGLQPGTPCSRAPGCQTTDTFGVFGVARSALGRELPPALEFQMVRSAAAVAANCLRGAEAHVRVTPLGPAEQMAIRAENLPPNTEFDLFVIQAPNAPFGLSWYQGDLKSDAQGVAQGTFIGRFNDETFIVAPGVGQAPKAHHKPPFPDASSNPATAPVHTFHLGLWFNKPADAARAGCPNSVTPFDGDHHAGIQALSTRNFGKLQGPLRQLESADLRASR